MIKQAFERYRRSAAVARLLRKALKPGRSRQALALAGLAAAGILAASSAALVAARFSAVPRLERGGVVMAVRKEGSLLSGRVTPGTFSPDELSRLSSLPGVRGLAPVRRAEFQVYGSVDTGGGGFGSLLFLESVPDDWLDKPFPPRAEGGPVPILVGETFLFLYNSAFAPAYGLPELKEGSLGLVPIRLSLSGRGGALEAEARVAGTSARMDSLIVPDSFLEEWNARLAGGAEERPSKVLLRVDPSAVEGVKSFCAGEGLAAERNAFANGALAAFLSAAALALSALALFAAVQACSQFLLALELEARDSSAALEALRIWGHGEGELLAARGSRVFRLLALSAAIDLAVLGLALLLLPAGLRAYALLPAAAAALSLAALHAAAFFLAKRLLARA